MPVMLRGADVLRREMRGRVDLTSLMKQKGPIAKLIFESKGAEFANQAWRAPDGRVVPWLPNVPFPEKASSPARQLGGAKAPGIASGALYEANVGGKGSVVKSTRNTVRVSVDSAKFPYEQYVRGGVGGRIRTAPFVIKPKKRTSGKWGRSTGPQRWAMWWYFFFEFGIALSEEKLQAGIKVPPRPYGTVNPALVKAVETVIRRKIGRGK